MGLNKVWCVVPCVFRVFGVCEAVFGAVSEMGLNKVWCVVPCVFRVFGVCEAVFGADSEMGLNKLPIKTLFQVGPKRADNADFACHQTGWPQQ